MLVVQSLHSDHGPHPKADALHCMCIWAQVERVLRRNIAPFTRKEHGPADEGPCFFRTVVLSTDPILGENMTAKKPSTLVRLPRMSSEESAEFQARLDAVLAVGALQIAREQEELVRRGILDANGNRVKPFVVPAGQSGELS
jgi:hypothetical protein